MRKCKICGADYNPEEWIEAEAREQEKHKMCFSCNFWRRQLELDTSGKRTWAVIAGKHYVLGENTSAFKGFGGRNFKIKFKDGAIKECNNLWMQGEIPEKWRDKFPDNAEFLPA